MVNKQANALVREWNSLFIPGKKSGLKCYITFLVPSRKSLWFFKLNEESHQLLRHSIISTNDKTMESDCPLSPYFVPSRASLRVLSILVIDQSQCNRIGYALRNDHIRITLGWRWTGDTSVLRSHCSALSDSGHAHSISLDPANDPHIIIGINENLDVHRVPKGACLQGLDPLPRWTSWGSKRLTDTVRMPKQC